MRLASSPRRLLEVTAILARWAALEVPPVRARGRVGERHVLMVADQFPPTVSGGVYRPLSFATAAGRNGWRMTVVTQEAPGTPGEVGRELERAIPPDVAVHRVAALEPSIPDRLGWEVDGGLENALALARCASRHCHQRPQVVLATGPHFHTFVAGFFLKTRFRSRLVLDYRDEWSECPFHFVRKGPADRRWERRCLAAADMVVFTTPSMREHALARFVELDATRAVVIENGIVEEELFDEDEGAATGSEEDGRATIGFMGNLSSHTDPASFLRTLMRVLERRPELADRLRLLWVGTVRPRQRELMEQLDTAGLSRLIPQLSRGEAQRLMHRCSLLLLLVNQEMDRYRPGKLYSYLASGRPILVYGSVGESGAIVQSLHAGVLVPDGDDHALEAALDAALGGGPASPLPSAAQLWVREMIRERLAERLYSQFAGIISPPSGRGHPLGTAEALRE